MPAGHQQWMKRLPVSKCNSCVCGVTIAITHVYNIKLNLDCDLLKELSFQVAHLQEIMTESSYYAAECDDTGQNTIFQLIALNPGHRRYVERVCNFSADARA